MRSSCTPWWLQTAPVARAIGAPECSRSSHQFLHDGHLHDKALQYSPHRICWLLAVHDDTERLPCLVGNDRFGAINLAGITVERYLKVVHPVWSQNKLRGWTEYLAMVAAWIVSFIANVAVVFPTSDVIDGVCYAYMIWKNQKARLFYFVWNFVSSYLVIIFVFVFCYGRILLVIRRQTRVMASHAAEGSGVAQSQCSRIQSSVTRTMVLVSAFYAISWLRIFPVRDPSSVPDISRRCLLCEHTSRIFVHVHESFHLHHQVGSSAHCLSRIASDSQRSPAASCAVLQDRPAGRWRCCLSYLTKATACAQFLPRDAMHPRY